MAHLDFEKATPEALREAQQRVALTDPDHLVRWLQASNRAFLVLYAPDLVDALQGPHEDSFGLHALQQVINAYRGHRMALPSGEAREEVVTAPDGTTSTVRTEVMKDDTLTLPELDRAIRQLVREMMDRDPAWKLTNDPL